MRTLLHQRQAIAVVVLLIAFGYNSKALAQQIPAKPAPAAARPAAAVAGKPPKVIVVGAGLAGAAAARDLVDAGVKDVLVLEARNRPGGRLHSVQTKAGGPEVTRSARSAATCCNYSITRGVCKAAAAGIAEI
jgi:hypothetical protein